MRQTCAKCDAQDKSAQVNRKTHMNWQIGKIIIESVINNPKQPLTQVDAKHACQDKPPPWTISTNLAEQYSPSKRAH